MTAVVNSQCILSTAKLYSCRIKWDNFIFHRFVFWDFISAWIGHVSVLKQITGLQFFHRVTGRLIVLIRMYILMIAYTNVCTLY